MSTAGLTREELVERIHNLEERTGRLEAAFQGISDGFVLFDANDRLIFCNQVYREYFEPVLGDLLEPGSDFETMLRALVTGNALTFSDDDHETQVRMRLARYRKHDSHVEARLTDGRWLMLTERHLPDGSTAITQTDISAQKDAERAFQESQTRLVDAIESMPVSVLFFDADRKLVLANHQTADFCPWMVDYLAPGTSLETILEVQAESGQILDIEDRPEGWLSERIEQIYSGDSIIEQRLGDGRVIQVIDRLTSDGGIIGIRVDISDLKRAEQSLRTTQMRLLDAVESLPAAFTLYDSEYRLIASNNKFAEFFPEIKDHIRQGIPFDELVEVVSDSGRIVDPIEDGKSLSKEILARLNTTAPKYEVNLNNGRTLEGSRRPTSEGGMVGLWFDVTDHKRIESDLRAAKSEAETANRAKSDFLSAMSHELRTPLNAILGFAQLLEQFTQAPLTAEQKEYVEQILHGGKHLLGLVNEVLDLSTIESGKLELFLDTVESRGAIEDALTLVRSLADERGIAVSVVTDEISGTLVRADAIRLRQVLLNVLSNAVKYNRDKGAISVTATPTNAGMMRISVSDTGPGIPADKRDEVFRPFSRLDAAASEIEGTGIGLIISRRLIESMGGTIDFESTVGEGTTFWIEIPIAEA